MGVAGYLGFDFGFWILVLECYCALIPKLGFTMGGWSVGCVPGVLGLDTAGFWCVKF